MGYQASLVSTLNVSASQTNESPMSSFDYSRRGLNKLSRVPVEVKKILTSYPFKQFLMDMTLFEFQRIYCCSELEGSGTINSTVKVWLLFLML